MALVPLEIVQAGAAAGGGFIPCRESKTCWLSVLDDELLWMVAKEYWGVPVDDADGKSVLSDF